MQYHLQKSLRLEARVTKHHCPLLGFCVPRQPSLGNRGRQQAAAESLSHLQRQSSERKARKSPVEGWAPHKREWNIAATDPSMVILTWWQGSGTTLSCPYGCHYSTSPRRELPGSIPLQEPPEAGLAEIRGSDCSQDTGRQIRPPGGCRP